MSHHVEQQAGEHIVANDGISMRNTPRVESPASTLDVGQLLGKNQTVNGVLKGAGDAGFQQVLASHVKREPAPAPAATARRDTVANDKASRSGGNSSPPTNTPTKNSASARKADRGNDKPQQDARRAENPADKRAGDTREAPEKASRTSASNETAPPSKTHSGKGEPAKKTEKDETTEAASPAVVDGNVANAAAPESVETTTSDVETAEAAVPETTSEASASLLAAATTPQTETVVAAVPPGVPVNASVDGELGVAENGVVATALAPDGKSQGVDASLNAGKDLGTLQRAISAADVTAAAPDVMNGVTAVPVPVAEDAAADDVLPDPALKDLITAMIRSKENAGLSAKDSSKESAIGSSNASANASALGSKENTAQKPFAVLAEMPTGESVSDDLSSITQALSASKPTNSAEHAMAALTRELRAQDTAVTKGSVDPQGASQAGQVLTDGVVTSELMSNNVETEFLVPAEAETSDENKTLLIDTEANDDAEIAEMSLDVENSSDSLSQSVPGTPNRTVSSAARIASPALADTLTATTDAIEATESTDSWSILDAAPDMMADESPAAEGKLQTQVQTEQQMALVRNELRNLERFVDGGLQAAVRSTRETRKDDKANDIKPAALSRAMESLGAGVKTAELRASAQVTNAPVAFGRQGFAEQMAEKIMLMTTQKVQVADIRLDPKEMGTIDVKIRVHQDQTSVVFSSANPQVREALETSIPRLREMFADAGVGLGSVNVNDRGTSAGGNNEQSQGRGETGGFGTDAELVDERKPVLPRQSNGLVDYYA